MVKARSSWCNLQTNWCDKPASGIDQLEDTHDIHFLAWQFFTIQITEHLCLDLIVQGRTGILIFNLIGYSGAYTDYGEFGFPAKQYPPVTPKSP